MKLLFLSAATLLLVGTCAAVKLKMPAPAKPAHCATCYGYADCRACKNCKYCGHCAKRGETCRVCAGERQ